MPDAPTAGQPTKYLESHADTARKLCAIHYATDRTLAEHFDVHISTIELWKKTHDEFSRAIIEGRLEADSHVETALHKRAMGFTRKIDKVMKDGSIQSCAEEMPPDYASISLWLRNRRSKFWRETQEINHKGAPITVQITVGDKSKEAIDVTPQPLELTDKTHENSNSRELVKVDDDAS